VDQEFAAALERRNKRFDGVRMVGARRMDDRLYCMQT
jgi:hypothetical protein